MKFAQQEIAGVFEITLEPHEDERGFFARAFCPAEFEQAGIAFTPDQINLSGNKKRHTLRGLHYQKPPHAEDKIVRCLQGHAFDVVVDLRPDSPTRGKWISFNLDAGEMNAVFIPKGCAHGFMTLKDNTLIQYQMGQPHVPGKAAGIIWNDPQLAIDWPHAPLALSPADQTWPDFSTALATYAAK